LERPIADANPERRFVQRAAPCHDPFAELAAMEAAVLLDEATRLGGGPESFLHTTAVANIHLTAGPQRKRLLELVQIIVARRLALLEAEQFKISWRHEIAHGNIVNVELILLDRVAYLVSPDRPARTVGPKIGGGIDQHLGELVTRGHADFISLLERRNNEHLSQRQA